VQYTGIVKRGSKRARVLGYPTANIHTDESLSGVFVARVSAKGNVYPGAAFADPARALLETYLFDFSGDLYGEEVVIEILEKIRESERFPDDTQLKAAIEADVRAAREYFKTH